MPHPASQPAPAASLRWQSAVVIILLLAVVALGVYLFMPGERDRALELVRQGRGQDAESMLRALAEKSPDDLDVQQAFAEVARKAGDRAAALTAYERWAALAPTDPKPLLALTELLEQQRRLPQAADVAGRALALVPDNDDLREKRAFWLLLTGQFAEADAECGRALERRPQNFRIQYLRAEAKHSSGDEAGAVALLDQLLNQQPNFPPALALRGALHLNANEPAKAVPLLRRVLQLGQGSQQSARHHLALALTQLGQTDEARRLLGELQQQQTVGLVRQYNAQDNENLQVRYAEALAYGGQTQEAVTVLERILEQTPTCRPAHALLADCLERLGQSDKAATHRKQAQP